MVVTIVKDFIVLLSAGFFQILPRQRGQHGPVVRGGGRTAPADPEDRSGGLAGRVR